MKTISMNKIILGIGLISFCSFAKAQNGLENIIVEKYYISDATDATDATGGTLPVGSVTYRIYVDMLPGYKFQAAYGNATHELKIATSTLFFNNEDRGATNPNAIAKTQLKNNTVMLDSWLSVGAASAGNFGVLKSSDDGVSTIVNADDLLQNNDAKAGIPLTQQDGLLVGTPGTFTTVGIDNQIMMFDAQNDGTNGPIFSISSGAWSCLVGAVGPTADNRVLIAQITTDGIFSFELNIQIGTPSGGTQKYVAKNPEGSETKLESLSYISTTIENMYPTINLTSPSANSIFNLGDKVNITANATDTDGTIKSVEFFVNDTTIGVVNSAPYSIEWQSTLGTKTITAKATDDKDAITTSSPLTITINDTNTSVNDLNYNTTSLSVYPNPTNDLLYIGITDSKESVSNYYIIYDLNGKMIFNKTFEISSKNYADSIDLSSLQAGQYIIELSIDGITSTEKIIKK